MSAYNYVKTTQASTAIQNAVRGNFLSPDEANLLVSKESRIEIYQVEDDHLAFLMGYTFYCDIETIALCKLRNRRVSSLFVLTKRQEYRVITFDPGNRQMVVELSGTLKEERARLSQSGVHCAVDLEHHVIFVSVFEGFIHVISLQDTLSDVKGKGKSKWINETSALLSSRIPDFSVQSMAIVLGAEYPTVALLCVDNIHTRFLKSYELQGRSMTLSESKKYTKIKVQPADHKLISVPSPYYGMLVIGEMMITYYSLNGQCKTMSMKSSVILACALSLFNNVFLLGDASGELHMLKIFSMNKTTVSKLGIETMGKVTAPSALVPFEPDLIFVGSLRGDSSLVRIQGSLGAYSLTTLHELPNLGPITDFCVYDLDKQGRQTIVCCSGVDKDGTLRVIQNGFGFSPMGRLPVEGIKKFWLLNIRGNSNYDDLIVVSTMTNTRLFSNPGKMSEIQELLVYNDIIVDEPTLVMVRVSTEVLVQITPSRVRLLKNNGLLVHDWFPPFRRTIVIAAVSGCECGISCGRGSFILVGIRNNFIMELGNTIFGQEICSMNLGYLHIAGSRVPVVAIGLWQCPSLYIVRLEGLTTITTLPIPSSILPHTLLLLHMDDVQYLFATSTNGQMIVFTMATFNEWRGGQTITLGTQAVTLYPFERGGACMIFAASDQPTIISSIQKQLIYSTVSVQNTRWFGLLNCSTHQECMILGVSNALIIGRIDAERKLQSLKFPLDGHMGKRLMYHDASQTLAVGTVQKERNPDNGYEKCSGWIRIFDARSFQSLQMLPLLENEAVESMAIAHIESLSNEFVFIGTARLSSDQAPPEGRVLMFQVLPSRKYKLMDAAIVPGVVHCIKPLMGSIVLTVNGTVYYLDKVCLEQSDGKRLCLIPKTKPEVMLLAMDTLEDLVVVGDMIQSVTAYKLTHETKEMVQLASDPCQAWIVCLKILKDSICLAADIHRNIFTMNKPWEDSQSTRSPLKIRDNFHLGDQVSCFQSGSLAQKQSSTPSPDMVTTIYGTVNGAIGVIAPLSRETFVFLMEMQTNILKVKKPHGGFDYAQWRSVNNDPEKWHPGSFIDGDLIESYLEMTPDEQLQVVTGANGGIPMRCKRHELEEVVQSLAMLDKL